MRPLDIPTVWLYCLYTRQNIAHLDDCLGNVQIVAPTRHPAVFKKGCAVIQQTTRFIVAAVILVAAPLASVARAQVTTATIVGAVSDSTGAAVPGATVTARNADTGFTRSVTAAGDGAYRLEF